MTEDIFLSSDELRHITKAGSSFIQSEKLAQLNIPFSLDQYGTPIVRRSDLSKKLKAELRPLYEKLNLSDGSQK